MPLRAPLVLALAVVSCRGSDEPSGLVPQRRAASRPGVVVDVDTASEGSRLAQLIERSETSCEVHACVIHKCNALLVDAETEMLADPRAFETLTRQVDGHTVPAVVALDLANRLLTYWQREGTLGKNLTREQRDAFVDAALTNTCAGPLFGPLTFPGQPLHSSTQLAPDEP
jgi:hypothetical protein